MSKQINRMGYKTGMLHCLLTNLTFIINVLINHLSPEIVSPVICHTPSDHLYRNARYFSSMAGLLLAIIIVITYVYQINNA